MSLLAEQYGTRGEFAERMIAQLQAWTACTTEEATALFDVIADRALALTLHNTIDAREMAASLFARAGRLALEGKTPMQLICDLPRTPTAWQAREAHRPFILGLLDGDTR